MQGGTWTANKFSHVICECHSSELSLPIVFGLVRNVFKKNVPVYDRGALLLASYRIAFICLCVTVWCLITWKVNEGTRLEWIAPNRTYSNQGNWYESRVIISSSWWGKEENQMIDAFAKRIASYVSTNVYKVS